MTGAAELARRKGVRLHTHLAETLDEEEYCLAEVGCTPAEYADELGWLGRRRLAGALRAPRDPTRSRGSARPAPGRRTARRSNGRLGAGIAPVRDLLDAGVPVGLGVDGAASNEAGGLGDELRQAMLQARQRGGPRRR